jgi:hypothetical protein
VNAALLGDHLMPAEFVRANFARSLHVVVHMDSEDVELRGGDSNRSRRRHGSRCGARSARRHVAADRCWSCQCVGPARRSRPQDRGSTGRRAAPTGPVRCGLGRNVGSRRVRYRPPTTLCMRPCPGAASVAATGRSGPGCVARMGIGGVVGVAAGPQPDQRRRTRRCRPRRPGSAGSG